jgi:(4S)-4-hydroxy-5-phosphonooxypentane-2,3-dione isomerase
VELLSSRARDGRAAPVPSAQAKLAVISLTVLLEIDPARVEEFLAAISANAAASRLERGCRRFEIHRRLERPASFLLWEVYDDLDALARHHASPHFARWRESSGGGMVLSKESIRCEVLA